jgi:hypothetical protein
MPASGGVFSKKRISASRPPADAPMPTTGKPSALGAGSPSPAAARPSIVKFCHCAYKWHQQHLAGASGLPDGTSSDASRPARRLALERCNFFRRTR